ncbi:MAG: hypothetical protein JO223_11990 [Hyphomicrobiales bacterium]|nr:hypothetical protein [Hyphomicrobiales bacterium]
MVFVGPTLDPGDLAAAGDFTPLPPVSQGDVYRAARRRPRAIGIIDGYFSGAPSVWHKEILWAISEGVPVFGSASMGALRAAELHMFGMRGVGKIFEAFRDGALEDDDEVAVLHGPAEIGYLATSEPMVNIRETLAFAETSGVLAPAPRRSLESFAKSLYFGERSWPALLEGAAAQGVGEAEAVALRDWLPLGRVDQKRLDALAMLAAMQEALASGEPMRLAFHFEWTYLWDLFVARSADVEAAPSPSAERILDELRIEGPDAYGPAEIRALLRLVAASGMARPAEPPREAARATLAAIRTGLGLFARADLDRWMSANDLDQASMERLVEDEARLEAMRERFRRSIQSALLDELRLSGAYARLADRAVKKGEALAAAGLSGNAGARSALHSTAVRLWYFEKRLGRPMPDDVADFARKVGFETASAFDEAVHREWAFVNAGPTKSP